MTQLCLIYLESLRKSSRSGEDGMRYPLDHIILQLNMETMEERMEMEMEMIVSNMLQMNHMLHLRGMITDDESDRMKPFLNLLQLRNYAIKKDHVPFFCELTRTIAGNIGQWAMGDAKEEVKAVTAFTCWQQVLSKANKSLGQIIEANAKDASVHFLESVQSYIKDELENLRCGHVKNPIRIPASADSLF